MIGRCGDVTVGVRTTEEDSVRSVYATVPPIVETKYSYSCVLIVLVEFPLLFFFCFIYLIINFIKYVLLLIFFLLLL